MASTKRRTRPPNTDLARLIEASGASHKALAVRVNQLAHLAGIETDYSHTSVANWCRRGMTPKWPVPKLLAQAISERLGQARQPERDRDGWGGDNRRLCGVGFPARPRRRRPRRHFVLEHREPP